jgi:hypothetical protein
VSKRDFAKNQIGKWPAGTITAAKLGLKARGTPPTVTTKAMKNAAMIWIWLEEKVVNVKIACSSFHITGCKKLEHASEAVRYIQQHIQLLCRGDFKPYKLFPFALRFDIHMINYNFNLGVALSLPKFDVFMFENYSEFVFSSYDENIHQTSMPMKCPKLRITYTVNDNGQISMCSKESDIETSNINTINGYGLFYTILNDFRRQVIEV